MSDNTVMETCHDGKFCTKLVKKNRNSFGFAKSVGVRYNFYSQIEIKVGYKVYFLLTHSALKNLPLWPPHPLPPSALVVHAFMHVYFFNGLIVLK